MSQDLDLYGGGGDLQTLQPGTGVDLYTPQAEDAWGETPDQLTTHTPAQQQQVEANLQQIASVFETDMAGLGFVQRDIDKCVSWFRQNLANPTQSMPARKSKYQLWQWSNDPAMNHFALYAEQQGFSQSLIQSICYWLQRLDDFTHGVGDFANNAVPPRMAPSSSDPTDNLSDADFAKVQAINAQAAARTEGILKDLWKSSWAGNMQVVQQEWAKLSDREQAALEQYTTGWIKGTNTPEVLLGLFRQAIGAGSLPKGGAAISQEIASIENVMRTNRAAYMKDNQMQARLRTLYTMRGD